MDMFEFRGANLCKIDVLQNSTGWLGKQMACQASTMSVLEEIFRGQASQLTGLEKLFV